jgi:hypothetical protein
MKGVRVPVDDSAAVEIASGGSQIGEFSALVQNQGADSVFFGGEDVTAADGFEVVAGDSLTFVPPKGSGERLYAICDTGGTAELQLLRTGS